MVRIVRTFYSLQETLDFTRRLKLYKKNLISEPIVYCMYRKNKFIGKVAYDVKKLN